MHYQDVAAGVRIIAGDRPVDLRQGQIIMAQQVGVDQHVILLDIATDGIDFRYAPD